MQGAARRGSNERPTKFGRAGRRRPARRAKRPLRPTDLKLKDGQMQGTTGYRLSPQQHQLWLWHQDHPVPVSQCAVSIDGPLKRANLKDACARVVGRHEALRTTFYRQAGMKLPLQVVNDDLPLAWDEIDLADAGACKVQAEIEARLTAERRRPLDLTRGPLVRFVLVCLSPCRHVLLVTAAALCADTRSLG